MMCLAEYTAIPVGEYTPRAHPSHSHSPHTRLKGPAEYTATPDSHKKGYPNEEYTSRDTPGREVHPQNRRIFQSPIPRMMCLAEYTATSKGEYTPRAHSSYTRLKGLAEYTANPDSHKRKHPNEEHIYRNTPRGQYLYNLPYPYHQSRETKPKRVENHRVVDLSLQKRV